MKTSYLCFMTLLGLFFFMQSCNKECEMPDINFPEYPQEKLQFNNVVFLEMEGVYTLSGAVMVLNSIDYEVPDGQVLKVESASTRDISEGGEGNGIVYVNDKVIFHYSNNSGNPYLPLWLPHGSYKIDLAGNASTGDTLKGFVSGILYDVVQ